MTRQELEIKAKEFDSKLKRHPMSSEELQKVLCDFAEALRIHDVVGRSEQLSAKEQDAFDKGYTKGWTEGFNSGRVNGD